MTSSGEHQIHLILGDSIYSRIRTERVFKGKPGESLVVETTFGWVIHGGDEYGSGSTCIYLKEVNDYEKLRMYSGWRIGVRIIDWICSALLQGERCEKRGRKVFEANFPWITGSMFWNTNETLSSNRLENLERKLSKNKTLRD